MSTHPPLEFHPDLRECVLEERTLPAYSAFVPPVILTTGGYVMLGTPPGLSGALGSLGGGGSAGGNVPSGFNINGFGMSTYSIGNSTGNPLVGAGGRGGALQGTSGFVIGSRGGSGAGGVNGPRAFGGSFSSGYNTGLNSLNSYGMGSSPVGSLDAYATTPGGGTEVAPAATSTGGSAAAVRSTSGEGGGGTGTSSLASPVPGVDPLRSLRPRTPGNARSLLIGPGLNPPTISSPAPPVTTP